MFRVRKMRSSDLSFATELSNTMNWNMATADFEFNMSLEPDGCFVLFEDEEPIGLATCISYGNVGWFGNLVVKERSRGKGAGAKLVRHALQYLRNKGVETVGLYAYPHLIDFYGRLGFVKNSEFAVMKTEIVSARTKKTADLQLITSRDLTSIVDLDSVCFGASRRKLLERVFLDSKNIGFIVAGKAGNDGYVGAKVFEGAAEIGPLVCKPDRPDLAVDLFHGLLERLRGMEAYVYVPLSEASLVKTVLDAGFAEEFRLQSMFFGRKLAKSCIYLAESLERG